jgi:broad specificity phosphatase PhoE
MHMTQIVLVRHGQTEWNRIERFRGRIDVPLNDVGYKQAEITGRWIASRWQIAAVYSSPLSRAKDTAQAIADHFYIPVIPDHGVDDFNYGAWQGKTPAEVQASWPELYAGWLRDPGKVRIPEGETLGNLRARTRSAVLDLIETHPHKTIVIVSHTIVNRAILLNVLNWPTRRFWEIRQNNCAINLLNSTGNKLTVLTINQTEHLLPLEEKREEV